MQNSLSELFNNVKTTENGDFAYKSTCNNLIDILFMSEYYQKHLDEVVLGDSEKEKLFAMFIRDPRFGLGRRDLGRKLMELSKCSINEIVKAGRYDDVLAIFGLAKEALDFLKKEIESGNELAKKWMPRYASKNLMLARAIAKYWGMNKQQYGHFIKANTVENTMSRKESENIVFEHVPSLAMVKYYAAFLRKPETAEHFKKYLEEVKSGKKELKISTTTVYDIYKNRNSIDPDLFFDKIEKISVNCLPIIDTSGSMWDLNDSIGKALAIGHYLAKCNTYAPNMAISFSSHPTLLNLESDDNNYCNRYRERIWSGDSKYTKELQRMYTGDCSNTDLGAVMNLLSGLKEFPQYLVVLSDMEFDQGSNRSKYELMRLWKAKGYTTKIIWWNFNSRATTSPEVDADGNIFLSGYNPMLLKYLEAGFNGEQFLDKLLQKYKNRLSEE